MRCRGLRRARKLICSHTPALHHVRLEEAQADLATAMSAILCAPCLSVPRKRAFALEMAKPALGLLRQMSDATHDVPGSVEAHRGSHLAASLLRGLCRLPAAWLATQDGEAAINTMPAGLTACINDLRDSRPIETTTLEPKLPHIEFLLLRLQHSGLVETTPGTSGGTPAASDGDGTISDPYARTCLDALAHYLTSRSALSTLLLPSSLRRLCRSGPLAAVTATSWIGRDALSPTRCYAFRQRTRSASHRPRSAGSSSTSTNQSQLIHSRGIWRF